MNSKIIKIVVFCEDCNSTGEVLFNEKDMYYYKADQIIEYCFICPICGEVGYVQLFQGDKK
jgi:hypothetical protein